MQRFENFFRAEDGAVTVDWVVITAGVVSLAVLVIVGISGSAESVGDGVGTYLSTVESGN